MNNVIKRVYGMGLRKFHAQGDSMTLIRALHSFSARPFSTSHRRCFRYSIPTRTSTTEVVNMPENSSLDSILPPFAGLRGEGGGCSPGLLALLDRDSRAYGFGYGYQAANKHDIGGRRVSADDSPYRLFHSDAHPVRVSDSGNIGTYSSSAGMIQRCTLDAGNIQSQLIIGEVKSQDGSNFCPVFHSIGLDYMVGSEVNNARFNPRSYLHMNTTNKQRLLQVFSVRMIDCENSEYLHGTIEFKPYADESVFLYERRCSDPELVSQDGTLSLTGPSRCLNVDQCCFMKLKLKDKNGNPFPVEDDEALDFATDCYLLEEEGAYDLQLKEYYYGNPASLVVYYTIFYNAVQAKVDVHLVKGDGEDRVYGRVVARYSNYDYSTDEQKKYFQAVLFDKSENNYVEVEPEMPIPLSTYVVAVPTTSTLIIEANLWSYVKFKPGDQIAKGTLVFQPETEGATTKGILRLTGLGEVRVTVTWGG